MFKIIDKAAWQIDGGEPEEFVIKHFQSVFLWLDQHDMLTDEGKEEIDDGIDDSASLNEDLLTPKGLDFLEKYYDTYIASIKYGWDEECKGLDKFYDDYSNLK
jgi:hypothetical protein